MTYKTILSGRLEFGSPRSFEQVLKMYYHRVENFYKTEFLLEQEEIFNEEDYALEIPRLVTYSDAKTWRSTISLLEYVSQYAIAGSLDMWCVEEGKVVKQHTVEPDSDKAAIQSFLKGRELVNEAGREQEAKKALSRAIEKFARHALAYERRGYVNYRLRNYEDAIYDFTKSIDINPKNADPYFGRALVRIAREDPEAAIADLEMAIKQSIPLQPIYWKARRIKGECHLKLEQYEKAIFEFKLFVKRKFAPDNPNYSMRKKAFLDYGRALLGKNKFKEAVQAFSDGLKLESEQEDTLMADQLLFRGIAMQKAGEKGYVNDWKAAADRGSKRAAELLESVA